MWLCNMLARSSWDARRGVVRLCMYKTVKALDITSVRSAYSLDLHTVLRCLLLPINLSSHELCKLIITLL